MNNTEKTKNRFDRSNLSVFLSYYRPHWKLFAGDMLCALTIAAIDTAFPVMSRYTLNTLIPALTPRPLMIMILIMTCMYIVRSAANWFVDYWGHTFGTRVEADMRRDLFDHMEKQSFAFFDRHRTGHLMSRVTTDLFEVTELAHHGPEDVFISVVTLLGSFIVLLTIRWELALVVFTYIPLVIWIIMNSRKSMSATSRKVKERTADINASLESSISGIRVTKAFTNEKHEKARFEDGNRAFQVAKSMFYRAMSFFHAKLEFALHMLDVIVLGLGGWFIMHGTMTLADLIAAELFVAAFLSPIRRLSNFVEQYTTGMAGFNRFLELMRTHEEIPQVPDATEISGAKGDISYKDVSFAYNENMPVLSHMNLDIKAGQTVALVGPSGAGKTTVCSLLPRFYPLSEGTITLDDQDITKLSLASLRRQIGLVQQDVFLFAGTIKENIAYGRIEATDEEIVEAAKRAEIHEDIMKMPNGYDTVVGERGVRLSGGQKQRVSIARTFLKNPPVLILDEATSALDTATEVKIQYSFDELSKGRTTIVIAHRLSTVKNADVIAVVTESGIAEQGTHEELLARGGLYKELYTAQYANR